MRSSVRFVAAPLALALASASVRAAPPATPEAPPAPGAAAAERIAAPEVAPAAPAPDLRVRPQVATLSDLRPLGEADLVVGERVGRLRTRRNVAIAAFGGAVLSGVVGSIVSLSRTADRVDAASCPPGRTCEVEPDYAPTFVAAGVSLGLVLLGVVVLPKRADVAETVDLWNGRHPEAPVEMEPPPERAPPRDAAPEPAAGER